MKNIDHGETTRPILFSGPMVRAILEGRKTQTRRIVKLPKAFKPGVVANDQRAAIMAQTKWYAQPRDTLWVRETFAEKLAHTGRPLGIAYRADGERAEYELGNGRWTPSILMPRIACRLFLTVTSIGVQRLRDISVKDCWAEGIEPGEVPAKQQYQRLWDSLNEKRGYGWATNPYVWVIAFRRDVDVQEAA